MKIYALQDPRTHEVRYVGATKRRLNVRLAHHLSKAKSGEDASDRAVWLLELLRAGLKPHIFELEPAEQDNWETREQFWIEVLGPDLLNRTAGGIGAVGMPNSVRKKISDGCKGKNLGNQHAAGVVFSQERREAMSKRLKGKPRDPETKKRITEGLRRYHQQKGQA